MRRTELALQICVGRQSQRRGAWYEKALPRPGDLLILGMERRMALWDCGGLVGRQRVTRDGK